VKITLIIFLMILSSSLALGETYTWEDADSIHFTDNPDSIPAKYREKVLEESRKDIQTPKSPIIESPDVNNNKTNNKIYDTRNVTKNSQITLNPPTKTYAQINKVYDFEPMSKSFAAAILLPAALSIIWILVVTDIIRNEFECYPNKTQWLLLLIVLPPIGILLYLIIGLEHKKRRFTFR